MRFSLKCVVSVSIDGLGSIWLIVVFKIRVVQFDDDDDDGGR